MRCFLLVFFWCLGFAATDLLAEEAAPLGQMAARTDGASRMVDGVTLELQVTVPVQGGFAEAQAICKITNGTKSPLSFGFGGQEGAHGMTLKLLDKKGKEIPYSEKGKVVFDPVDFTENQGKSKYSLNALKAGETLQYHARLGDCFELEGKTVSKAVLTWNRRWDYKAQKFPPIEGLEVELKLPPPAKDGKKK